MTWTNLTFSFGAVLTSSQMANLDNNFEALAAGDVGAPSILNAALGTSCVTQNKLSTSTASGSTTTSTYALTGGNYSWWTISTVFGNTGNPEYILSTYAWGSNANQATGILGLTSITLDSLGTGNTTTLTAHIDERYITASPPYGTGSEDWPLFIYVMRRISDGYILAASSAPDPIWAYHGPTNINYDFKDVDGRLKKKVRAADIGSRKLSKEILNAIKTKNLLKQEELFAAYASSPLVEIEVTKEYKNSDMNTHAHPWIGSDLTGVEIILLEPRRTERLYMLHTDGENIRDLVLSGDIVILDDAPGHVKPVGVRCCEFKFS